MVLKNITHLFDHRTSAAASAQDAHALKQAYRAAFQHERRAYESHQDVLYTGEAWSPASTESLAPSLKAWKQAKADLRSAGKQLKAAGIDPKTLDTSSPTAAPSPADFFSARNFQREQTLPATGFAAARQGPAEAQRIRLAPQVATALRIPVASLREQRLGKLDSAYLERLATQSTERRHPAIGPALREAVSTGHAWRATQAALHPDEIDKRKDTRSPEEHAAIKRNADLLRQALVAVRDEQ